MDVMELANYAVEKNYRIVGSGTDDGIFKAAAKKYGQKYGFAWDGASGSIDVLKKKLKAGRYRHCPCAGTLCFHFRL